LAPVKSPEDRGVKATKSASCAKYYLIILDDLAYVRKDQAETSVLLNSSARDTSGDRC
jgi:hypothetical protein